MATQFKPGDTVIVKHDLEERSGYAMFDSPTITNTVIDGMLEYAGQSVVIEEIYAGQYKLVGLPCLWTDEMFEPAVPMMAEVNDLL